MHSPSSHRYSVTWKYDETIRSNHKRASPAEHYATVLATLNHWIADNIMKWKHAIVVESTRLNAQAEDEAFAAI
jgi:hypothetical protein